MFPFYTMKEIHVIDLFIAKYLFMRQNRGKLQVIEKSPSVYC